MAGLLDKAKASSGSEVKDGETSKSSGLLSKGTPKPVTTKPLTKSVPKKESTVESSGNNETAKIINIVGWSVIFIGALLSLQGGGWGLVVVVIVLGIGLGSIIQSQRMFGNVSKQKMIFSISLAVLIAVAPYAAVVLVPSNASMAVTGLTIDEEENEISFLVRGSFLEASAEIFVDGTSVWTGSKDMDNDLARFSVPISTIFSGNALDYRAQQIKEYTITVSSSDDQERTIPISNDFMTREVLNSAAKISKVLTTSQSGGNSQTSTDGVTVEASVGLFSPSEKSQVNGSHSLSNLALIPVASDYSFQLIVKKGSSIKYTMNTVSVNGLDATWSSSLTGSQSGKTSGWLGMPGTSQNQLDTEYLQRDDFYDGDGCYTFEITVTNTFVPSGGSTTVTSSDSWNLDWHESDSTRDGEMSTC